MPTRLMMPPLFLLLAFYLVIAIAHPLQSSTPDVALLPVDDQPPALTNETAASPLSNTELHCYLERVYWQPVSHGLCFVVMSGLARRPDYRVRQLWHAPSIAYHYEDRHCQIRIATPSEGHDWFTVEDVVKTVENILNRCKGRGGVPPPGSLGGSEDVGTRGFRVMVSGSVQRLDGVRDS